MPKNPESKVSEKSSAASTEQQPVTQYDFEKIAEGQDANLIKAIDRGVYDFIAGNRLDDRIESYTQETGHVLPGDEEKAGRLIRNILTMYKPRQGTSGALRRGFVKAAIAFSPEGLGEWQQEERRRSFRTGVLTSIPQFKMITDYAYRRRDESRVWQIHALFERGLARAATENELLDTLRFLDN